MGLRQGVLQEREVEVKPPPRALLGRAASGDERALSAHRFSVSACIRTEIGVAWMQLDRIIEEQSILNCIRLADLATGFTHLHEWTF